METYEPEILKELMAIYSPPQSQQSKQPQTHALLNQHQLSEAQQSTPPRQYTTVGSVYNPQSQPLQPPIRRGRTVKTLFPFKSESPAGPSMLQYTALQQNSDRAVSPVHMDPHALPSSMTITRQERQVLQKFGVAVPSIHQPSTMPSRLQSPFPNTAGPARYANSRLDSTVDAFADPISDDNSTIFANAHADSDNESDEADTKPISAMNFNSLTNLASYPNPMQRAAQKVLASHRPQPAPTIGSQVSDSQSTQYHEGAEPLALLAEVPAYMSFTSKVRGAPAPLTAGPPGVRQLRPTVFEQDVLQRAREFDDENPVMNPYHMRQPLNHQINSSFEGASTSPVPTPRTAQEEEGQGEDDEEIIICKNHNCLPIFDTLSIDEARKFYPNGLPLNFDPHTQSLSCDWELERLKQLNNSYSDQNAEFWAARSRDINNSFYSGIHAFNKTFQMAVSEHKHRSVAHIVGAPYEELANKQGKITNRELQITAASLMPTSEHAEPLLSMAFQTLTTRPEISPYTKLPRFQHSLHPPYLRD